MRELDRNPSETPPLRSAVIGAGRLGHALTAALTQAGLEVEGPLGRGADPGTDVVLLTVPDQEIATAAAVLTPLKARFVGHCSGATP
jgi:predicted dinucleotide-binding enzyme